MNHAQIGIGPVVNVARFAHLAQGTKVSRLVTTGTHLAGRYPVNPFQRVRPQRAKNARTSRAIAQSALKPALQRPPAWQFPFHGAGKRR